MRQALFLLLFFCCAKYTGAQELFIRNEPASTVPKGTLGIRMYDQTYPEKAGDSSLYRNLGVLRVMYGATSKLTVMMNVSVSNHHDRYLPQDLVNHDHSGGGGISTGTPEKAVPYPYLFNGFDFYAKYRFLTFDGANSHFRLAAWAEGSKLFIPSHEAEPELLDLTSGVAGGFIATYLQKHFAASLTTGYIHPTGYSGPAYDKYGGNYPVNVHYGYGVQYNLSFGYLLLPHHYTGYNQMNWNLYLEFTGKSYGAAKIVQRDGTQLDTIPITAPLLKAGNYIDVNPGIQCIIRSNLRIEASMGFHLLHESYAHLYPLYMVGVQRYFYFNKKRSS